MDRTQMTFYKSFWDAINGLPKKDQLPVFRAVVAYGLSGKHSEALSPTQNAFFTLMQPVLDSSRNKASNRKQTDNKPKTNEKQIGKEKEREKEIEKENENENEYECIKAAPKKTKPKQFGQYGWVKLTEEEHSRLIADLGEEEVTRCITYVDESAQGNSNKNKWRDWNLVIRRCSRDGWGLKPGEKKAKPMGATWKPSAAELEAIQRVLWEG